MVTISSPKSSIRLPHFIRQNLGSITQEWMTFARSLSDFPLTDLQLQNHVHHILFFIADDIESVQTPKEQKDKSLGKNEPSEESPGCIHGELRYDDGYNLVQMVKEFRALRASILRLWIEARIGLTAVDLSDLVRFNEAIDQLVAESIAVFMARSPEREYAHSQAEKKRAEA